MKTLLTGILLVFILPKVLMGQGLKIDEGTGKYSKQATVEIDSMAKGQIFKKAVEWIALNYKSANDAIQLKDEETGRVILKGNFSTGLFMKQGWIRHTLVLDFKDNKFRYTYTDFSYFSPGSGEMFFEKSIMSKNKVIAETEANIDKSILSLKNYILKRKESKDNW